MNENTGSSKKRKALSATLTVAMAATMLLSGTLAYFYHSVAVNQFSSIAEGKNVVGHDDFDPETGNKDVYMENLGTAPVYVRIRLSESFEISGRGGSSQQMETYESTSNTANSGTYSLVDRYGHTVGNHIHGYCTEDTDILNNGFAAADDPDFHSKYFKWTMGGSPKTYLSAASDAYQDQATVPNAEKYKEVTTQTNEEGTLEEPITRVVYDTTNDGNVYTEGGTDIKTTSAQEEMITMSAWSALPNDKKNSYTGWILDDSAAGAYGCGWYYWSQPLMGDETTGLLLNHVETQAELKEFSYNYNIYVEFEAVDETDKGLWLGTSYASQGGDPWDTANNPASHMGKKLINFLSGKATYGAELDALIEDLQQKNTDYEAMAADEEQKAQISYAAWGTIKAAMESIANGEIAEAFSLYAEALRLQENFEPGTNPILFSAADTTPAEGETEPKIDPVLFDYIKEYDLDGDKQISKDEAYAVRSIELNKDKAATSTGIKTLNGITNANFPNLTTFIVRKAEVTAVDGLSLPQKLETFWLTDTPITTFDATKLTNLKDLALSFTNITNATLTGLSAMKQLTHLDLRGTKLTGWDTHNTPALMCLEIGGANPYDMYVYLGDLEGAPDAIPAVYGKLDLDGSPNLNELIINANRLQKIDVSGLSKMKAFPNMTIDSTLVKMVIHRADQTTFKYDIPENADFTRLADGTIKRKDGTICKEDGTPITTP